MLYLSSLFYIFKKKTKNLNIPVLFLSFVNDRLFISQEKSFEKMNSVLFCSYNIISFLFEQFSLVIKYGKCEVFHLSRFHDIFDPPPIDISQFGGFILKPKDT